MFSKNSDMVLRIAKIFSSPEAMQAYLKEHPKAKPEKHSVRQKKEKASKSPKVKEKVKTSDPRDYESMSEANKRPEFQKARTQAGAAFKASDKTKGAKNHQEAAKLHGEAAKAHTEAAAQLEKAGDQDGSSEHKRHAKKHQEKSDAHKARG
jgi:hypothetical protein